MTNDSTPPPPPPTSGDKLIPFTSSSTPDPEWSKLDDLIKMWILGSLCDSLQEQVVSTSGNAKALWDHLKELFHDNKHTRAITLDNELRSIKIESMSVNDYCTKIKSMADRLHNLGSPVSENNLVTYAVNGLDSRFTTIVKIIRHRETLPTFETARNMLLLEESTFNASQGDTSSFDSDQVQKAKETSFFYIGEEIKEYRRRCSTGGSRC
ncbi:hybrid signal transduction histidine kinase M [Artemisia annua]|uniref:Hybrid signal transduction histidine kinase M n=1 Tax=Artemisia annua TaxID=35608 RepID=A0A2U1MKQ9_ARTAN|nr:hybrid signal transduction histidine kinase M [Artemisia annua]